MQRRIEEESAAADAAPDGNVRNSCYMLVHSIPNSASVCESRISHIMNPETLCLRGLLGQKMKVGSLISFE